ncbi:MAG: plastocyanin/azurin family copper-binding protein [Patescibacteria group bacterium]
MQKKFIFGIFVLLAVLTFGCTQPQANGPTGNATNTGNANTPPALEVGNFTVEVTAAGYAPQNLTIKKGSTVTWVNKTSTPNWPATAQHPTHDKYPGSSITKCGTGEAEDIFDACKGLEEGQSFSFTFNEAGEWAYHEHLTVKMFGKITVVE